MPARKTPDLLNQTPRRPRSPAFAAAAYDAPYTANSALKANKHYTHALPGFKCRKCATLRSADSHPICAIRSSAAAFLL